jgi:hypothetical protein
MIMYYALILVAGIGAAFFYGPLIAKWTRDMWRSYFKKEDDDNE